MSDFFAQVRLASDSGLAEDIVVNTWTFALAGDEEGAAPFVIGALAAFYQGLDEYLSPTLAGAGHEVRLYRVGDPEPRVPFAQEFFALAGLPSSGALPREVAVCLSFKRTPLAGQNPARRRGRVYIGPLHAGISSTSGSYVRPSTEFMNAVIDGAHAMADYLREEQGVLLAVRSRVAGAVYPVDTMWIDNEWDTQRRRGTRSTTRFSETLELP